MSAFNNAYDRAIFNGKSHEGVWKYAAQAFVDSLYKKHILIEDNAMQKIFVNEMYEKYRNQRDTGRTSNDAWEKVSNDLKHRIEEHVAECEQGKHSKQESRSRQYRTREAFDDFEDMVNALPPRGSTYYYSRVSTSRVENISHSRPPPPLQSARVQYQVYEPQNTVYSRPSDQYDSLGSPRSSRPIPPRPNGAGKYRVPEPEYAEDQRYAREPQYYYTEERRPRKEPLSPRCESYKEPPSPRSHSSRRDAHRDPPFASSSRSHNRSYQHEAQPSSATPRYESRKPHAYPSSSHSRPHPEAPPPTHDVDGKEPATCFYRVLGIAKSASPDEVKRAYRKASLRYHPDRASLINMSREEATEKMAGINQANDVLSDGNLRARYDRTGRFMTR